MDWHVPRMPAIASHPAGAAGAAEPFGGLAVAASLLKVGRTDSGYCLRLEGSGTVRESRAAHEFIVRSIEDGKCPVALDLSACPYMDSTFLGCLIDLHRKFGSTEGQARPLFTVAAPSRDCRQALAVTRIDRMLHVENEPPRVCSDFVALPAQALESYDPRDLAGHIAECHRLLADMGGPSQEAFRRIADAFEREMKTSAEVRPGIGQA